MKLFAGLRKIRGFQKVQLPYLNSLFDFDIVIEIGYAEELGKPLTLKQLFLLNISSRTTIRRKLARLIDQGVVAPRKNPSDQRATLLAISVSSAKVLAKYGSAIASISASHFNS
jgi:DNA-binding MarR family transcriptional regulator